MTYRINDIEVDVNNPFKNDALGRKPLVEFLSNLIGRLDGPFVMALDSPWGSGKTTLVRMLKANLECNQYQCLYFNAWQVDYVTDPLVAMVSSIDRIDLDNLDAAQIFKKHVKTVKKITSVVAKRTLVAGVKALTLGVLNVGQEYENVASDLTADTTSNIVDAFSHEIELLESFRTELTSAIEQLSKAGKKPNLIFFIDELDRCRPSFAIELLERVKHLFDIQNIIFVLSIDKQQLEASTAAVYGAGINAPEYLRRFIDLEYGIPVPDVERYTESLIERFGLDTVFAQRNSSDKELFVEFFVLLSNMTQMSLRARERCMTRLKIVIDQTPFEEYFEPVLVTLLIILRLSKPQLFSRLLGSKISSSEIMDFFVSLPSGEDFYSSRSGIMLDAYLQLIDTGHKIGYDPYKQLVFDANNPELPAEKRWRANELINEMNGIRNRQISARFISIAAKVDLAAMIH